MRIEIDAHINQTIDVVFPLAVLASPLSRPLTHVQALSKSQVSASISRAFPSIKHAQNLSRLLETALMKLPVPSLHGHIDDLFEYFQRTLEENSHVPVKDELEELAHLTIELRKGIKSLSENKRVESQPDDYIETQKNSSSLYN